MDKIENWTYSETQDTWTCAAGNSLHFRKESKATLPSGYEIHLHHYRSQSCGGCPLKDRCTKAAESGSGCQSGEAALPESGSRHPAKRGELCPGRMSNDGTGKCIWTTEEQPGLPELFASRHEKKVTLEVGWLSLAHHVLKPATVDQKRRASILQ